MSFIIISNGWHRVVCIGAMSLGDTTEFMFVSTGLPLAKRPWRADKTFANEPRALRDFVRDLGVEFMEEAIGREYEALMRDKSLYQVRIPK